MLRAVRPRDPKRPADVVVSPISPRREPFEEPGPSSGIDSAPALVLEPFRDEPNATPVTVVHPWQRQAPPPLPQVPQAPEDG